MHEKDNLVYWLKDSALPFWKRNGIDIELGGFYEQLNNELKPIIVPRRSRLVARQIYSFTKGYEIVTENSFADIVHNGLSFLEKYLINNSGQIYKSILIEEKKVDFSHDLYDYAFVIFAMSKIYNKKEFENKALNIASKSIDWIKNFWRHNEIGFLDGPQNKIICRSNPHMHLLEASLSWEENNLKSHKKLWQKLSDEIIELAIRKLIDPKRKILYELFDPNWKLSSNSQEQFIEPGHQYEWAWLIMKWSNLRNNTKYIDIAKELVKNADKYGYDEKRKVCINSLDYNLNYLDKKAKLWPQTERLKALISLENLEKENSLIRHKINESVQTIKHYIKKTESKIWQETINEEGNFTDEPIKASSLYHLVTAIGSLKDYLNK